jgi:hypothetical protein
MPNAIKYKAGNLTGSLQKGNVALGVSGSFGPTSTTGWYNGPNPPTSGLYQIIETAASGDPEVYSPQNDAELIRFARWKGATGANTGSAAAVLAWIGTQTNLMAINFEYESIVTDGLVMNLDAGFVGSYPTTASTWYDLSGNVNTGSLINGVGYSSANSGSLVFDGTDDYVFNPSQTTTLNLTTSNGATMMCWLNINVLTRWTGVLNFWPGVGANNVDFGWDITNGNEIRLWKSNVAYAGGASISPYNNQWILYTLISTSTGMNFYTNNNIIYSVSASGNINSVVSGSLYIGDHWDNPVSGKLSTVQIYNRSLTSTEVTQNYNAQKGRFGL